MANEVTKKEIVELGKAYDELDELWYELQEYVEGFEERLSGAATRVLRIVGMKPLLREGVYCCENCGKKFNRGERPDKCPECKYKVRWI